MTTFTLTVDDHVAALIRRVAVREQKDETLAALQLLEWAAARRGTNGDVTAEEPDEESRFAEAQNAQIRQIFERNEW